MFFLVIVAFSISFLSIFCSPPSLFVVDGITRESQGVSRQSSEMGLVVFKQHGAAVDSKQYSKAKNNDRLSGADRHTLR